jgi:hypothetical protein
MHATLVDKDDPKRENRLAKEFKHSYKIFWQNTQSSYPWSLGYVYTDWVNTQSSFCMHTVNLHHREIEFRHLIWTRYDEIIAMVKDPSSRVN